MSVGAAATHQDVREKTCHLSVALGVVLPRGEARRGELALLGPTRSTELDRGELRVELASCPSLATYWQAE